MNKTLFDVEHFIDDKTCIPCTVPKSVRLVVVQGYEQYTEAY